LTDFRWTEARLTAAELLAEDKLSDEVIAQRVGVTRAGLAKWKTQPEFMAKIDEFVERFDTAIRRRAIARQLRRVAALQDRWERMHQVIDERAVAEEMRDIAGGTTGLLVRTFKVVGNGPDAHTVPEFAVDTGLLKELREHEKQAAQELGQWTEKREVKGEGAGIQVRVIDYRAGLQLLKPPEDADGE
jgi:hypothetical protein